MTGSTSSSPTPPALVQHVDRRHGVAVVARAIAGAVRAAEPSADLVDQDGPDTDEGIPQRAHVHFTDRLWAASPELAAERFAALADGRAVTVTLHDIPQASDGPRNLARRSGAYARVVRAAAGVVVNSQHEASLLAEAGIEVAPGRPAVAVIPLAIDLAPGSVAVGDLDGRVAVLGFFYPGKGHDEVVDAVASLGGRAVAADGGEHPLSVVSLGGVSPGHEGELAELVAQASGRGVAVEVSGYLDDKAMLAACRAASVPVVAHRHFSASGSLAMWIAAGRRPVIVDSRYAREMAALRPGTMTVVARDALPDAIRSARLDPSSTLIAPDASTAPGLAEVAAAYLRWWRDEVTW
ncbi:MAG: hypothetical protein ABWZ77_01885 [Naasia sp.]